jgi:hypothetical protein
MSLLDTVIPAIFNPARSIGPIAIQCTLEESHFDELVITQHPVEQGAAISDHAYKQPAEVIVRAGWSNSGLQSVITDLVEAVSLFTTGALDFGGTTAPFNYASQVYQQLLTLQASRVPFSIITGKRTYSNMLIRSLHVTTDQRTEHALMCTAVCRQVLTATTQIATFPSAANMSSPQNNAAVTNQGAQSLLPGTLYTPPATAST